MTIIPNSISASGCIRIIRTGTCLYRLQDTILDVSRIITMSHPDTLFKHDTIDTAHPIRKNWKALFKMKCFKMNEAARIQRTIPVLVRTKIVGTLIEDNFFINFCQQKLGSGSVPERRHKEAVLHTGQYSCDCPCCISPQSICNEPLA